MHVRKNAETQALSILKEKVCRIKEEGPKKITKKKKKNGGEDSIAFCKEHREGQIWILIHI